jgi:PAS domain S-box-containing protein
LLAELSAHFVNLPADQIYSEIEAAQRRICELLDLDRSGLWQVPEKKPGTLMLTHVHPPIEVPPSEWPGGEFFPWSTEKLLNGEIVSISKMTDLPPEACRDRESFQRWSTKATVVVPLSDGGRVVGALSFARFREEGDWPETVVMGFQLLARVFANALARKRADEELRGSEQRLDLAADSAGAVLWSLDLTTGCYWATKKFREVFGVSPDEVVTFNQFLGLVHPDDREMIRQAVQATVRCREECNIEYRISRPDGSVRWMALRGRVDCKVTEEPNRIMGASLDITARKRMEEQLRDRLQEIENLKQLLEKENVYLREEVGLLSAHEEIIGESDAIRQVLGQAEQVAPTDSTVLITGETGTGKELIARAIHSLSKRKDRVMVKVDCAALPSTLIESELFGREKGAYTGAMTKELGRFELADGSTLFLDEIGELSKELQTKLLRMLQSGEFERLGSPKTIRVDVRVIAATNRNLEEQVKKGTFREDLYYRLNVFPIEMPPLRKRPEDIPRLVRAFVKEFNKKIGKRIQSIPKKTMELLERYNWPGNIRELRNVIEHAVIVSNGEVLNPRVPKNPNEAAPPIRSLKEAEYQYIMEALEKTGWRIKGPNGAAEILKLKPSTLYNKMNKLGIALHRKKDRIRS